MIKNTKTFFFLFAICMVAALAGASAFIGCATAPAPKIPPFKIVKTALAASVDPTRAAAALEQGRTVFSADDPVVASVIEFQNLYGLHYVKWEWIGPDGRKYLTSENFSLTSQKDKYVKSGTTWHEMSIKGDPAQRMTGKWTVNMYVDGARAATDTFYLTEVRHAGGLPPILNIKQIRLSRGVLEGGKEVQMSVTLENAGPGDAKGVYLDVFCPESQIELPGQLFFETIPARGGEQTLTFPVKGKYDLQNGTTSIDIQAVEPNFKVKIKGKRVRFQTRKFRSPKLILAKFAALESESIEKNNQIEINEMVDVKIALQNVGDGPAENVNVDIVNTQKGVMFLGRGEGRALSKDSKVVFDTIEPGQYKVVTYRYFINSEFVGTQLEYRVTGNEAMGRYGFNESRMQAINTTVVPVGEIRTVAVADDIDQQTVQIADIPDFEVDVDVNIPKTKIADADAVAVVIGNKTYRSRDVPEVKYAIRDARTVKSYLVKTLGYPEKNIIIRYNATLSDFNDIFGTYRSAEGILDNYIKPGRSDVFIYYSGHGAPDLETKTGYFVPVDCDPTRVRLNGYPLDLFYKNVSRLPAKHVTVVLDACFSGIAGSGKTLIPSASPTIIRVKNPTITKGNTICMTSSTGDQVSSWYDEKQHGLFTYFFLKGLSGDADADQDRRITYAELFAFVADRQDGVPYYARRLYGGRTQTPQMQGEHPEQVFVRLND